MCWHVILPASSAFFAQVQLPVSLICDFIAFDELDGDYMRVEILFAGMSCCRSIILLLPTSGLSTAVKFSSWLSLYCTGRDNDHTTTIIAVLLMNWPHISLFTFFKSYNAVLGSYLSFDSKAVSLTTQSLLTLYSWANMHFQTGCVQDSLSEWKCWLSQIKEVVEYGNIFSWFKIRWN